jgi:AbrB family looped-hinge helix DNA binding protein
VGWQGFEAHQIHRKGTAALAERHRREQILGRQAFQCQVDIGMGREGVGEDRAEQPDGAQAGPLLSKGHRRSCGLHEGLAPALSDGLRLGRPAPLPVPPVGLGKRHGVTVGKADRLTWVSHAILMAAPPEPVPHSPPEDIVVTLSSKGQLVIPKRFRRLLGLGPGSRLAVRLRQEGLELRLEASGKTASAREVIGCSGYQGPALPIEALDPARFAAKV